MTDSLTDSLNKLSEMRRRKDILRNFDEIAEKLAKGETVDLNTFVPDDDRRKKINADIVKTLENKQKL